MNKLLGKKNLNSIIPQSTEMLVSNGYAFDALEKKLTKELVDRKLIKSFREIKKMDRIEINEENYKSILDSIDDLNLSLHMHIPFITKGVLVLDVGNGDTLYYHFIVTEINLDKGYIKMNVNIYLYYDDYYSKLVDFEYVLHNNENNDVVSTFEKSKHDIEYYYDIITDKKNPVNLTEYEQSLFRSQFKKFLSGINSDYTREYGGRENHIHPFANCMVYLNNCIEKQCIDNKINKSKSKTTNHDNVVKLMESKTKNNTVNDNVIIINGIKIKKGENSEIKTHQGNLIINRHTQVWGVVGHFRHYKNGKTVYIHPYKKGPGRNKEEVGKTIYKLKTE